MRTLTQKTKNKIWQVPKIIALCAFLSMSGGQAAMAACTNPAGDTGDQVYNSSFDVMQYCDGTDWTAMRGDGDTLSSLTCTDGQIAKWNNTGTTWECSADGGGSTSLWLDNTTYITREGLNIVNSAETALPAVLDDNGKRVFFYPNKTAFRGGEISGGNDAWEEANIGEQSFVYGLNSKASGPYSAAFGRDVRSEGQGSFAAGYYAKALGTAAFASGFNTTASGSTSTAIGNLALASGLGTTAIGQVVYATGQNGIAIGNGARATGYSSMAFGKNMEVGNGTATDLANAGVAGRGNFSVGFGLGDTNASDRPRITGNNSFAVFFGDQPDSNLTQENVLGLVGGQLLIDGIDNGTDTNQGCLRYNETSNELEFSNNCEAGTPTWSALGGGGSSSVAALFDADGDTSIRVENSPDNDTIQFFSDGVTRMTITNDGRVGIRDSSPDGTLHLDVNGQIGATEYCNASGSLCFSVNEYVARGLNDLSDATTGINMFIGPASGNPATTGAFNFSIDTQSLQSVTTGNRNLAVGRSALQKTTTGSTNVAIGHSALQNNISGEDNIAIGRSAGHILTTGNNNIVIGNNAYLNDGTSNSIIIGKNVVPTSGSSVLNIGNTIYGDMSNDRIGIGQVPAAGVELDVLGDIEYTGTITDVSDRRLKNNIVTLGNKGSMIDLINQVQPVSFSMKDDPSEKIEFGVIAQDFEKIFPELVNTAEDDMKTKSVNYVGLIAPMIQALQELKSENDIIKAQNQELKSRLDAIEAKMTE